jgi:4'-phosphopantetheinyl transferase
VSFSLIWPTVEVPQKIAPKQIHVWTWQLGSSPNAADLVAAHVALLDGDELSRFHRFHFERDRFRFAIAHANLRLIIGAYLDRDPKRLVFRANLFGKPEMVDEAQTRPFFFNLSHSRDIALLALSMDTDVGVDIEHVQPIEREVAESHFSSVELSALASLKGEAWIYGFYHCWTRKEAILKAEGIGLNLPLDSFDVSLVPGAPAKLLRARLAETFRYPWALHDLSPAPGTVAALAAGNSQAEVFCFRLRESALDPNGRTQWASSV